MSDTLRNSRQQWAYANTLWQDMLQSYGNQDSPDYWRQRMQRRAYQGAIVQHLLNAGHSLAQATLQQLIDTQRVQGRDLSWPQLSELLRQQTYLSAPAEAILQALNNGPWQHMLQALDVFQQGSIASAGHANAASTISVSSSDNYDDPDQWPVGEWLRDMRALQELVQSDMLEF